MSSIAQKIYKRKVSSKNQVTIPRSLGARFDISPHQEIIFSEENGRIYIDSLQNFSKKNTVPKGLYIDDEMILDIIEANQYANNPHRLKEEKEGPFCSTDELLSSL